MDFQHREEPAGSGLAQYISDQADDVSTNSCSGTSETGTKLGRPLRPRPVGFVQAYIANGAEALPDLLRCHPRSIRRWRDEIGREALRTARRAYVERQRELRRQRLRRRP
jgi:hypothetical protein